MPLISQSDPGPKNMGLANGHTLLRHLHDATLVGTLQHRWMNEKKNVKPEISWSQLRRRFTPGFEEILDVGVNEGWYDPSNLIQALVFRWVFIPWLQRELDAYRDRVNNTAKRADRNKVLPHGIPNHMYESPEDYGVLDFKIQVDPTAVAHVRNLYAPPDHDVFQLVLEGFALLATDSYAQINSPPITRSNVWNVYLEILLRFQHLDNLHRIPQILDECWGYALTMARDDHEDDIALLPNLPPLESDPENYYMGGVNNGRGLDDSQRARLDEMMENDDPLPAGLHDIEEEEELIVWFSDAEEEQEEGEEVSGLD
ncbi:hypothetical protein R3P38DRAFT_3333007 [Favolaschia claudopus]|uniref:Uncharacterized protein n=1 Tax=Favolaschia claudopus TaxID=2862362 RepID=A0AAV9ZIU4_9AGAR